MEILRTFFMLLFVSVGNISSTPTLKSALTSSSTPDGKTLMRSSTFPKSNAGEQGLTLDQILAQTKANKDLIMSSVKENQELLKKIENALLVTQQESSIARTNTEILLSHFFYSSCYDIPTTHKVVTPAGKKTDKEVVETTITTILPPNTKPIQVQCETNMYGIGWTVILNRNSGKELFNRTYKEYENGFGTPSTEYYIGNKALHALTTWKTHELRIELEDFANKLAWTQYDNFRVGTPESKYQLTITGFNKKSTAGDGMVPHNGMKFSTFDSDTDTNAQQNCAIQFGGGGGWWYSNCYQVLGTGEYRTAQGNAYGGISYYPWHNVKHSLKKFKLLIRPLF